MNGAMYALLAGLLAAGYLIAALFFVRFWSRTRDRLFVMFALAFGLLATQRIVSVATLSWTENTTWMYLLRLAAFLLILAAILDKNRPAGTPDREERPPDA